MTRGEIIRMAREAGIELDGDHMAWMEPVESLERFAALIVAAEREACARICEEEAARYLERAAQPEKVRNINPNVAKIAVQTCEYVASAIRARGDQ